jgi:hypothetical protein
VIIARITYRDSHDIACPIRVTTRGAFVVVVTPDGREHALTLEQSSDLVSELARASNDVRRCSPGGAS